MDPWSRTISAALPSRWAFEGLLLKESARQASTKPFQEPVLPRPDIVSKIDYDAWGAIHYRPEYALWADDQEGFPVTFFHDWPGHFRHAELAPAVLRRIGAAAPRS